MQVENRNNAPIIDQFDRIHDYLRISLTDKCNFRCLYCMPNEAMHFLPSKKLMQANEIIALVKELKNFGLKKVRFTGGEPLVRKDFQQIIEGIASPELSIHLTTNGVLLDQHLPFLQSIGLEGINISLDTLKKERFLQITQRDQFDKVMQNILRCLQTPIKTKINVVLMRNQNTDELADFVHFTKDHTVDIRFIEFMPFHQNEWEKDKVFSFFEILSELKNTFDFDKQLDPEHSTSRSYKVKGYKGTFGIISTITNPFCQSCNRMRITADGKLKNCLFDINETDLLANLRSNSPIIGLVREHIWAKHQARGGLKVFEDAQNQDFQLNRKMIQIGG